MYQGLRGIVYKVSDLDKAKDWYCKVFDSQPFLDTSFTVLFSAGDSVLALSPAAETAIKDKDQSIAYWEVDDIDPEFKRLLQLGATVNTEINVVFNRRRATVVDPFGNIFGIRTTFKDPAEAKGRQIIHKQSNQISGQMPSGPGNNNSQD